MCSHSPQNFKFGHFVLFCRGQQRNVPKLKTHVLNDRFSSLTLLFCGVVVARVRYRIFCMTKADDTPGDFIRRSPRSAKFARCARWSDCDLRRSPRSSYKMVRYRRLNSPAFAKCARSRDFLRSSLRIAGNVNTSGWAILSHDFSKLPHRRDQAKKSLGVRFSLAIKFAVIGV